MRWVIGLLPLVSASALDELLIPSFPKNPEQNATVAREYRGEIPTVYADLRAGMGPVRPGLPSGWPHATVGVGMRTQRYYWSASSLLVNPPGSTYTTSVAKAAEDRYEVAATLRQSLWLPIPWDGQLEVEGGIASRSTDVFREGNNTTYTQNPAATDPRMVLLLPIWQERYAGCLVGGGVSLGVGDTNDWIGAHGAVGWIATIRWSSIIPGVPLTSLEASFDYNRVNHASNPLYTMAGAPEVTSQYSSIQTGTTIWCRCVRWASVGLLFEYQRHSWYDLQVDTSPTPATVDQERVLAAGIGPAMRVQYPTSLNTSLALTKDLFTNTGESHAWQIVASAEIQTW